MSHWRESDVFSDEECAALAYAEAVSATPLAYSKVEALSWNNGVPVLHLSNGKEVGVDALRQLI